MYCATTNGIKVSVRPEYSEDRSDPAASRYFWLYTIDIANEGANAAQLTERYWLIVDANGHRQEVRGPGVVGEQPMLKPGELFRYTSGCPLSTPSGIMSGSYKMVDENGRAFDVKIPSFSLDSPFSRPVLN